MAAIRQVLPVLPGPAWRRGAGSRAVRLAVIELGVAAGLLTTLEIGVAVAGPFEPVWFAVMVPVMALTYVAAGLLAWYRRPSNRTGALLVTTGLVWFVTAWEFSGVPWLIAVARVIALVPLALILHLLLAFPSGRLAGRLAKWLVVAGYVVACVLEAPRYLFQPEPSGLLQVADLPGLVTATDVVEGLAAAAVIVTTSALLTVRLWRATPTQRRTLAPLSVFGMATILFIILSANVLVPVVGLDPIRLAVMQLIAVSVIPVGFAWGVLPRRVRPNRRDRGSRRVARLWGSRIGGAAQRVASDAR